MVFHAGVQAVGVVGGHFADIQAIDDEVVECGVSGDVHEVAVHKGSVEVRGGPGKRGGVAVDGSGLQADAPCAEGESRYAVPRTVADLGGEQPGGIGTRALVGLEDERVPARVERQGDAELVDKNGAFGDEVVAVVATGVAVEDAVSVEPDTSRVADAEV